jgi:hypothetical protein
MEVEAESVAYVVAGLAGFDTSAYSIGYINGWANQDIELMRSTATRVLKAAQTIATHGPDSRWRTLTASAALSCWAFVGPR